MISTEEGQKEFHELEGRLKYLHEKELPIATASFFPIPAMIECAKKEDEIIGRMKELKREFPSITSNIPAFSFVRMRLGIEANIQTERFERLRDDARREGYLTPEYEETINETISSMKALRKNSGIITRIIYRLAIWEETINKAISSMKALRKNSGIITRIIYRLAIWKDKIFRKIKEG